VICSKALSSTSGSRANVSNFRAAQSGHLYFTLKDAHATDPLHLFPRSGARAEIPAPKDGLHVTVSGLDQRLRLYAASIKFTSPNIEPVGLGALQLAFEQLKKRLQKKEGLFDESRKKKHTARLAALYRPSVTSYLLTGALPSATFSSRSESPFFPNAHVRTVSGEKYQGRRSTLRRKRSLAAL